jgi:hypothetical protein
MTDDEIKDAISLLRWKASRADAPPRIWELIAAAEHLLKGHRHEVERRGEIVRDIERVLSKGT